MKPHFFGRPLAICLWIVYYNTYSIYHGNNRKVREMP